MTRLFRFYCFLFSLCCILPTAEVAADDVADLIKRLKSDQPEVRYDAARSLKKLGPKAEPAIKPLIVALEDNGDPTGAGDFPYFGPRVHDAASDALVRIGPPAKAAVPALRTALMEKRESHIIVRRESAKALGKIGAAAKPTLPDLMSLKNSDDESLSDVAAEAIEKIKKTSAE